MLLGALPARCPRVPRRAAGLPARRVCGFLAYRRRVPSKKKANKRQVLPRLGSRGVHMMASIRLGRLVDTLARFLRVVNVVACPTLCARRCRSARRSARMPSNLAGLSSPTLDGLEELTRADGAADDSLHDVVHLSVPASARTRLPARR